MVTANILDPIHDTLDPTVWDAVHEHYPALKPQHKAWIMDTILDTLKRHGYGDMDRWLEVYLTGSLTTFQYSDDSDCDVSLFVNTDVFPEWSRAEMIGIMVSEIDNTRLPGTTHPMQCYVVPKGIKAQDLYKPGLRSGYFIERGAWVVPPERDRVHNVEQEMNADYQYALQQADKMERLLRYEPHKAVQFWHQIHMRRQSDHKQGKGDYSQSNIIYKFLANRGLFPQIEEVSGEHIANAGPWGYRPVVLNDDRVYIGERGDQHSDVYTRHGLRSDDLARHYLLHPDGVVENFANGDFDPEVLEQLAAQTGQPWRWEDGDWQDKFFSAVPTPWSLNEDAIERARKHLGIYHPVSVNLVEGHQGRYHGRVDGTHQVDLVKWLRPEAASKQLWHELAHAKQWERDPKRWEGYMRDYDLAYSRGHGSYVNHPWEVEAHQVSDEHPFPLVDHAERIAANEARVLYNKFTPANQHPRTRPSETHDAELPFTYDPEADIVHLGPANAYHWELIEKTPELAAQYPMDRAYHEFSGLAVPSHLHGRMTWPDKLIDFMGLTDKNSHHRDRVTQALGGTERPPQDWDATFSNINPKGQHVGHGQEATHTGREASEEVWAFR